jgi:hypothetical protein
MVSDSNNISRVTSLVCPGCVQDLSIHDCYVGNIAPTCQQSHLIVEMFRFLFESTEAISLV